MTTIHRQDDGIIAFMKGAPEEVVTRCDSVQRGDQNQPINAAEQLDIAQSLAAEGHRVLAFAYRRLDRMPADLETTETEMTLLGFVGLVDPPRPEARAAIAECKHAGIVPVMITGDHLQTALRIARQLNIAGDDSDVMTGKELSTLTDEQLDKRVRQARVYARVDPEQKIRIVRALQRLGEFVAMTGDGVNDAPALKRAGIGIAMGKRGDRCCPRSRGHGVVR